MIINRQNYQIWIIDYYDGQLDNFQAEMLMDFLSKNPDLISEFEYYTELILSADQVNKFDNTSLLHTPEQLTNEQVEHFAIALTENDLDENQRKEITELKKTDPRFRKNINIYEKIKLEPLDTMYPDKSRLFKIPVRRKVIIRLVNTVSAAASVAIITGLFLIFIGNRDESSDMLVSADSQSKYNTGQIEKDRPPLIDITEDLPSYITARSDIIISKPVINTEIILPETLPVNELERIHIKPLEAMGNINLQNTQYQYLLAETLSYPASYPGIYIEKPDMSVREFIAYHIRKDILNDNDPDPERLKAWEIADAGIKGFNKVLGWNMQLETAENESGGLQFISFTSELVKFDHDSKKNEPGL
ncbi:MAG TPA: hypothetical protein DEQ09_04195 [Bacteroidales bacterium]|nr:hypothetical protein [Bacteroidales bacterium]